MPDLAERWSVDADGRGLDLRAPRRRPLARRRAGHRRRRRLHDPDASRTRPTRARPPARGTRSTVEAGRRRGRSSFTLATPLGGFLQAATQPIAPAHLLADIPVDQLADDPFGQQPIGSGPFARGQPRRRPRRARPGGHGLPGRERRPPMRRPAATDSLADARPDRSARAGPSRTSPGSSSTSSTIPTVARRGLPRGRPRRRLRPVAGADRRPRRGRPAAGSLRYPGSTLTAVLLNLRPATPSSPIPAVRTALLEAIDRAGHHRDGLRHGGGRRRRPDPAVARRCSTRPRTRRSPTTRPRPRRRSRRPAGPRRTTAGACPRPRRRSRSSCSARTRTRTRRPSPPPRPSRATGRRSASTSPMCALPPGEFVTGRLATGKFQAAVADVTVGLDPDLYPLLASSQTRDRRLERHRPAGSGPRQAARRGPRAGHGCGARGAPIRPSRRQLAKGRYLLPLAFADESSWSATRSQGPAVRQVADPADRFWDVLTWRLAAGR